MSTNRSRRIDRDTAEHLLGGDALGTKAGRDALSDLLAAAAAPATEGELAGEEAALAAFREAARLPAVPQSSVPQPRRRSMADCAPVRLLSAKAVAAALVATALGGVAVAAGAGYLPGALGGRAGDPATENALTATPVSASAEATGPAGGPADRGSGPPVAKPAPLLLAALCRAWSGSGQATTDPRFEPLTRAAGGPDRVRAYCTQLLGQSATAGPGGSPQSSASGQGQPGEADGRGGPDRTGAPDPTHGGKDPSPGQDQGVRPRTPTPTGDQTGDITKGDHSSAPATGDPGTGGHNTR